MLILDLLGVAVFAASGASAAVAKRLDLFGVAVLGVITALGGGVIRDLIIDTSPTAFWDWRYVTTAAATAVAVFWVHSQLFRLRKTMLVLDAAGLALFTVIGTAIALGTDIPFFGACLVGMITGVGGGVLRDVLTNEVPAVLCREIYALASLAGAMIVALAHWLEITSVWTALFAAFVVFVWRILALYRNWSVPLPRLQ